MNEIVYLENDEEITSVIDRLRKAKHDRLALVIPRGGNLAQSIVNLKLLKRSAEEMGKEISLVANDKISRNLASQIGLIVYSKAAEAEKASPLKKIIAPAEELQGDFKVNSYYGKDEGDISDEKGEEQDLGDTDDRESGDKGEEGDTELVENRASRSGVVDDDDESDTIEKEEIEKSYKEPEENQDTRYKKQDTNKSQNPSDNEKMKNEPASLSQQTSEHSRFADHGERKPLSRGKKIAIGIIAGCIILLLAVGYIFLPYASAKVLVKTEDLSSTDKVTISPAVTVINQENLTIPATTVELEKEVAKTYPTTGKKDTGDKATGKITITNSWDTNTKTIPAGTKFTADDGKIFINQAEVVVPGLTVVTTPPVHMVAGTIDINVIAENTGESYNIGPSHFSISSISANQKSLIYGQSASAMTGGTTKTVNVVSDADYKSAVADLTKTITDLGKTELAAKAKDEKLEIIESKMTSELLSKEGSKNIDDVADNFDYRINMKLSVLAYSSEDLKTVLMANAEKNLASEKMLIGQDKFEISTELIGDVKAEAGVASSGVEINGTLKGKTGQKISDKEIKDKIKGKKYSEAKTIIEKYDRVDSVVLDIWPSNVARVPFMTSRIKITFDYAQ